ncbi:MAG: hypothetical protein ACRBFS_24375 [Aureispira sp.]
MKVTISFPQIVLESKEVEVSEKQGQDLLDMTEDQATFIWKNMTEQERNWTAGKKQLEDYVEYDICGIEETPDHD